LTGRKGKTDGERSKNDVGRGFVTGSQSCAIWRGPLKKKKATLYRGKGARTFVGGEEGITKTETHKKQTGAGAEGSGWGEVDGKRESGRGETTTLRPGGGEPKAAGSWDSGGGRAHLSIGKTNNVKASSTQN